MDKFYLFDYERLLWWRPGFAGYTDDLEQAGVYTAREASAAAVNDIALETLAIPQRMAIAKGTPAYHPYYGARKP